MTREMEGQVGMFAPDIWFSRTSADYLAPTVERTSRPSSRKSSGSSAPNAPMCLCLTRGGASADRSAAWERTSSPFPWLGEYTMHSTTVYRNGEKDYAFWLTSTDTPHPQFCLTLNLSERPRTDNPTRLSDILESNPDPKYSLSAVACAGIIRRADNRGKELPEQLKTALKAQIERSKAQKPSARPRTR